MIVFGYDTRCLIKALIKAVDKRQQKSSSLGSFTAEQKTFGKLGNNPITAGSSRERRSLMTLRVSEVAIAVNARD